MTDTRNNKDAMPDSICLDGIAIAKGLRKRANAVNKTMTAICRESKVSYRTYLSWRSYGCNPSFASLKLIDAVLKKYEARKK